MIDAIDIGDMNARDFEQWLDSGEATLLLPAGAVEQHGPHLPLTTDVRLATEVSRAVAQQTRARVAPPIVYGYKSQQKSGGGNHLPGTTCVDGATLIAQICDVSCSYFRQGVKNLVVVNGHFENYQFIYEGLDLAHRRLASESMNDRISVLLSYWDFVTEETLQEVFPDGFLGWDIEHGGVLETSLMMYLCSELVGNNKFMDQEPAVLLPFDRFPIVESRTPATGCLSSPFGSSVSKGSLLFSQVTESIATAITDELKTSDK